MMASNTTTLTREPPSNSNSTPSSLPPRRYLGGRQQRQGPLIIDRPRGDGPTMFDSASNFTVSGGTFNTHHIPQVTVNISHGSNSEPASNIRNAQSEDTSATTDSQRRPRVPGANTTRQYESHPGPVRRSNVLYEQHLSDKGRGHPLWIPQPNLRLPIPYRAKGVSIGDVGIITPDGAFDFLFNICLPVEDPVHCEELPEHFSPLNPPLSRTDIREFREYQDGNYLASASVTKVESEYAETRALAFQSSDSEGAILTMPEGAYLEELNNIGKFRDYISLHGENWYKFVNGPRGREAKNGDLRLVIGVLKSTSWGIAIFSNVLQQTLHLEFRVNPRYDENGQVNAGNVYDWYHVGTAEVRTGPGVGENDPLISDTTSYALRNQCLFVRTLSVELSGAVWEQLYPKPPVEINLFAKPATSTTNPRMSFWTRFKSSFKVSKSFFSGGSKGKGVQHTSHAMEASSKEGNDRLNVFVTPSSSYIASVHPSKVLNDFLLKEVPEARMSIVDDRDWCTSSLSVSGPSNTASAISRILEINNVTFKNGMAYFEPREPDDIQQSILQVDHLIDGSISVEQYLFGGQGGAVEDIWERRNAFLDELQYELMADFLVDGIDLPTYIQKEHTGVPNTIGFLESIQDKARAGNIEVTSKHPRSIESDSVIALRGHPHRLLTLNEVVHLAGTRSKRSDNLHQTATGTETIKALRSCLDRYPTTRFIQIRIVCMLRLGEALLRRFSQFHQREDLDEAICYYKNASISTPSTSHLHLEAHLGLCESLYRRLRLLGNFEDLVGIVKGLDAQLSHDLFKLLTEVIHELRDPPPKDLPFFDLDQKLSTTLPLEPKTAAASVHNQSDVSTASSSRQTLMGKSTSTSIIRPQFSRSTDTQSQFTDTDGQFSYQDARFTDSENGSIYADTEITDAYSVFADANPNAKLTDKLADIRSRFSQSTNLLANTDSQFSSDFTDDDTSITDTNSSFADATSRSQHFPDSIVINRQHANITNSTSTTVAGDYHYYEFHGYHEGKFSMSSKAIAADAVHDLLDRSTWKRHPGTRENIIAFILSWIKEEAETRKDILWIHGPPGSGKSTIMQSIAELCFNCPLESRHPGAIFFFARRKDKREDDHCLYTTLSYSLGQCIPGLQETINHVMVMDPIIHEKDPDLQLRKLVFEPLRQVSFPLTETPFIIIDGLDECKGHDTQKRILDSIVNALKEFGPRPRFIITARPEANIRDIFETPEFRSRTDALPLDILFDPTNDIRLYLEQSFEEITNRSKSWLKTPWYKPSDIEYLVEKSSGQFLYAATVVKFVGTELAHPAKQLKIVLKPSQAPPSLYSNIDDLYTQILETIRDKKNLLRIFDLLLTLHCPQPPEVYDDILGFEPGHTTLILRGLHSIIRYPHPSDDKIERRELERRLEYDKTRGLRFHYASFQDFLLEKERSKAFFVDLSNAPANLVQSGFNLMTKWISWPWRSMPDTQNMPNRETWGYLKHHMGTQLAECQPEVQKSVIDELLSFRPSFPPPTPIEDSIWVHSFDALHSMVTVFALMLEDKGKQQLPSLTKFHSEHSHWAQDCPRNPKKAIPEQKRRFGKVYIKYCALLDQLYSVALSSSSDILQFLDRIPGLGLAIDTGPIPESWLHNLFKIDLDEIFVVMQRNRMFFHKWDDAPWNQNFKSEEDDHLDDSLLMLNPHFALFLSDRDRAGQFYEDPKPRVILDCSHVISMIFSTDWLDVPRSRNQVTHLDVISRRSLELIGIRDLSSSSEGHPIVKLLTVFRGLHYDLLRLQKAPMRNVDLVWSATRRLLEWIQRQHQQIRHNVLALDKFESLRIQKTLVEISNQIYKQILRVKVLENGTKLVAICDPFLVSIDKQLAPETHSDVLSPPPSAASPGQLIISETLLSLNGLRSSLLGFLTSSNRAQQMHFSPEEYHTQFAEICLTHCDAPVSDFSLDWRVSPSQREWRFHLVRARPSNIILSKLRTITVGPWLAQGLPSGDLQTKVKSIVAIIEWLDKDSNNPPDISEHWRQTLADFRRLRRWKIPRTKNITPRTDNILQSIPEEEGVSSDDSA